MKHPSNWFNSLLYACNGLRLATKERNVRFHLIASVTVIVSSSFLSLTAIEWAFIMSAIALVLITEFMNTAIECICDLITTKYSIHIKQIKDIAAAAVIISTLYALIIAVLILSPKILFYI
jgi:undecaprenol kinase